MNGRNDLAIVLTARLGSQRLPNKALADVSGRPLLWWIVRRLQLAGNVILATTRHARDDELESLGEKLHIPVYRGSANDVVMRIDSAVKRYAQNAKYIMRGLGDCPYISPLIVLRATETLSKTNSEAFAWHLPPNAVQRLTYGSREFPYSRSGWQKIVDNARDDEREHVDLYFHRNREEFKIAYHEAPPLVYFRNYRLEVDWVEDLELVRKIANDYDPLAELDHIIRYIDINNEIARINRTRVEKTGLSASYSNAEMRTWFKLMRGVPIMSWDDTIWEPNDRSTPVFCLAGTCLLGYADSNGVLHRKNGDMIVGKAKIDCPCKSGRIWNKAIR